ncbi:hypothetical protein AGDE_00807 [Angomonas deanei]|uniref:IMS import disulfide relay-system CHCH-CHCH-like Cx9C domain-containing protein n=1 Tax=Angomonas deanei TaxID=59799 RepID=A0A7G2CL08_9TRYP|nr:hypothetical protein AGDE_00807 [Angomonas deanei]CAD2220506.1 hypothetical protein, conserved [Angomonas deanei]|eukprot:EPY43116.1 hypothetical protein AGDE_00807 [Angomonas deanei]
MEGNFYVSDIVIDQPINSRYGKAYAKCPHEAQRYGTCLEMGEINRNLAHNMCVEERKALRECVDKHLKMKS